MVSRTADAQDVQGVIETNLSTGDIENYIDDAAYEANDAIANYTDKSTEFKTQLEKYLASLRIREIRDRSFSSASRETASVDYEGMSISALRKEVEKRDPSGSLAYNTNSSRYVNSGP